MALTFAVDGFLGAMNAAARYIGAGDSTEEALRGELGKVLERAVDYTHSAPSEEEFRQRIEYRLRRKFNTYAAGDVGVDAKETIPRISNCPGTGRAWWVDYSNTGRRAFYLMNDGPRRGWGDRYARYQAEEQDRQADLALELEQYVPKVLASRGLSKQSWYQIGQALGITVPGVPPYVKDALGSDGRAHLNGTGTRTPTADGVVYELVNSMPLLISPRHPQEGLEGENILERAFTSRDKAIMVGIEKGILDDLEKAIKRFPGLALAR